MVEGASTTPPQQRNVRFQPPPPPAATQGWESALQETLSGPNTASAQADDTTRLHRVPTGADAMRSAVNKVIALQRLTDSAAEYNTNGDPSQEEPKKSLFASSKLIRFSGAVLKYSSEV